MPWAALEERGWAIVGLNHYRVGGHLNLFVSMAKAGRCIKAEGPDQAAVFRELEQQAQTVERGLAPPSDWDEPAALRELVASLWLYIGHYAETQLATELKELLYDVVEQHGRETGTFGEPMERWWRAR